MTVMALPRRLDHRTATELRVIDGSVAIAEAREAWGAVRVLSNRVHLAVVADRPDLALHSAGRISSIADRALRRLDGGDAA